jgi:hypothetical protein
MRLPQPIRRQGIPVALPALCFLVVLLEPGLKANAPQPVCRRPHILHDGQPAEGGTFYVAYDEEKTDPLEYRKQRTLAKAFTLEGSKPPQ